MCEYHRPLIRNPRLGVAAGGDRSILDRDERERLGRFRIGPRGGNADRAIDLSSDAEVAADIEQDSQDPQAPVQCDVTGPLDDEPLGDAVETERASRQPLCGA